MPFRYSIDLEDGIIEIVVWGRPTAEEFDNLVRGIHQDPRYRPGLHAVYDARKVRVLPGLAEIERMVAGLATDVDRVRGTRRAVVEDRPTQRALTGVAASLAGYDALDASLRSFGDRDAARTWLLSGRAERGPSRRGP